MYLIKNKLIRLKEGRWEKRREVEWEILRDSMKV